MKQISRFSKFLVLSLGAIMFAGVAHAQLFIYTGTSTAASSSVINASSVNTTTFVPAAATPTTTSTATTTVPAVTILTTTTSVTPQSIGFYDVQNLVIDSVGGSSMVVGGTAASVCTEYVSEFATLGTPVQCPNISSNYTVNFNAATQFMLANRTAADLDNFSAGNTINAFGYYDGQGDIDADIIRDLANTGPINPPDTGAILTSLQGIAQSIQDIVAEASSTQSSASTSVFVSSGEAAQLVTAITALQNIILEVSGQAASGPLIIYTGTTTIPIASTTTSGATIY